MWNRLAEMYITLTPVILGGIVTMIWVKIGPKSLRQPLDNRALAKDGRPIFGENKTWLGVVGYLLFCTLFAVVWGWINRAFPRLEAKNDFYTFQENTVIYNFQIGLLLGLAYSLFELPNSFLKRRAGVTPGKPAKGVGKVAFKILDLVDSIIGCVLVLRLFYPLTLAEFILYILVGGITHLLLNVLLYGIGLRRNPL